MNIKIVGISIILLLVLIILSWKYRKAISPIQNYQPFANVWKDSNKDRKEYLTIAKTILKDADDILRSKDIIMIPMYGTLLGMVRHKGVIPWDDDIDVCIPLDKFKTCQNLKDRLYEKGIGLVIVKCLLQPFIKDKHFFMKLFSLSEPKIKGKDFSWPFIDIFGYVVDGNTVKIFDNTEPYKYNLDYTDLFPLRTGMFEDITLPLPNNPDNILKKLYTSDWKTTCVSASYNHRKEQVIEKVHKIQCKDLNSYNIDNVFNNVWVVNLDRRNDRWNRSRERLQEKGIIAKRWSATDAQSDEFLKKYNEISTKKLSKGEVACYMSHQKLWMNIYNSGEPVALIFEDDLIFAPQVGKQDIINAIHESNGYDIIYLGHCYSSLNKFQSPFVKTGTAQCLHAYVITRNAIHKLLSQSDNFGLPIDKVTEKLCTKNLCFISHHVTNEDAYGYGIVHQDNELGSDIRNKTKKLLIM